MPRYYKKKIVPAMLFGLVLIPCVVESANMAEKQALPGMTYPSLSKLPDWSGWWSTTFTPRTEVLRSPPPMRPEDLANLRSQVLQDSNPDPMRYCRPLKFVGHSGGANFISSLEFLFTPGRVTLTNEEGLIRRIYTDGRPVPQEFDDSNTGTSVGHWEGKTLVVETVGINPLAPYPAPQPSLPIGKNVRITERIFLKDKDTLQFDVTTVAPDLFTAPDRRTRLYQRVSIQIAHQASNCVENDRSVDPVTGKQRLDMTPPADLPPPPSK